MGEDLNGENAGGNNSDQIPFASMDDRTGQVCKD